MSAEEEFKFEQLLEDDKFVRETRSVDIGKRISEADEYEITNLY